MEECELPDFYDWSEPVARRTHTCCECKAPILKGEKHFHGRGKWGPEVTSYRQHLLCAGACELIRDVFYGECIGFGTLKEQFDELDSDNWYPRSGLYEGAWAKLKEMMARIKAREQESLQGNLYEEKEREEV